jgi:hypothetical protein
MPIPLGVLAVAGAGAAGGGNSFDLLETVALGSDTSSITFSSLNTYSDYKHLQVRGVLQGTGSNFLGIRFDNSSGGTDYATHRISGDGSSLAGQADPSNDRMIISALPTRGNESNTFFAITCDLLNFSSTNQNKVFRGFAGTSQTSLRRSMYFTSFRASTAALTSVTFEATSANLSSGSRLSLYGIRG